jgi:uncharacterized protein (TIGR02444 family)
MTSPSRVSAAAEGFWRYSLAIHARPGVPEACVTLQDAAGVDVNVMLYLLFLAESGWTFDDAALARLDAMIGEWRAQVVRPLRAVRRALKTDLGAFPAAQAQALRNEVKRIELESERLQQVAMEQRALPQALGAEPGQGRTDAATRSLRAYEQRCSPFPEAPLRVILAAFAAAGSGAQSGA